MRGLVAVFDKELADYLISWRGIILFAVALLITVVAIYGPAGALVNIREQLGEPTQFGQTQFVFLTLFTTSGETEGASFLFFITMFVVPIVGIVLGFDAINREKNSGTLSRLLSQPIYRDTVFNGKFLAGTVTMAIMLTSVVLLVAGLGMRSIGVPPSSEEALRLFLFLALTTLYGSFWLGLSMLFSVLFERVATSAMASIAIWIFFLLYTLTGFIPTAIANMRVPISDASTTQEVIRYYSVQVAAERVSPIYLFQEAMYVLMAPGTRTATEVLQIYASGAEWQPSALPISQTMITIWPHLVTFVAIAAVFFGVSYYKFTREEIRST
jgi:ABC-2 type transport system permease protein